MSTPKRNLMFSSYTSFLNPNHSKASVKISSGGLGAEHDIVMPAVRNAAATAAAEDGAVFQSEFLCFKTLKSFLQMRKTDLKRQFGGK